MGTVVTPVFVGRDAELARLGQMLVAAEAGTPATALVSGEAGVGKSRLLREFAQQALDADVRVLRGSCIALIAGEVPYAPLIDALRRLAREVGEATVREVAGPAYVDLARLFSDITGSAVSPTTEPVSQVRVFSAVLRLLEQLGAEGVVVLILEDLQWADPSTLDLLAYVARSCTDEHVLLVGSYRSNDLHPRHPLRAWVSELEHARCVHRIELSRFNRTELALFLRATTRSDVSRDLVDRAFELADGNAFFTEELVVAGILANRDGSSDAARLPGSLRDLLLARFELLGDDAHTVMRVAATAGRRVSHRLLATVCELGERRILHALRECVSHHMLLTDPADDTYTFRHALLREAVHQDLLPGERLRLHAAIATALAADTQFAYAEDLTVAAELSYHWFEAGAYPEALAAAVRAGDTATRMRAFQEAERQYRRASDLWRNVADPTKVVSARPDQLLASAADAARWAGHIDAAVDLIRRALAETPPNIPARRGELFERLGSFLWEAGDSEGSHRAYTEASELLAGQPQSATRVRVLAGRAFLNLRSGGYQAALTLGNDAVDMAREVGARVEEGRALNMVGMALTMIGRPDDGVEALRAALAIADAAGQLEDQQRAYGNLTVALENAGRLEESVAVALAGIERIRTLGLEHARGRSVLANNAGAALMLLGRWDEANEIISDILVDRSVQETRYARLTLAEVCVGRGRFDDAEALLAEIGESGSPVAEPQFAGALHACRAERAIWQRQLEVARRAVMAGIAAIGHTEHIVVLLRLYALGLRVEADRWLQFAALPGRPRRELKDVVATMDEFATSVSKLAPAAGSSALPDVEPLRLLCGAERVRIDDAVDTARWDDVATAWDALDRPYPTAYARWRLAEAAAENRDSALATQAARTAHGIAVRLGARPLREEIEALARHARLDLADVPKPVPQPKAAADPFGLTPREREVLRRLYDGESNRQIAQAMYIAEKTAGVHVSNILMKLGVSSRNSAAAIAHRLNLFDE